MSKADGYRVRVSLIVSHPGADYDAELKDQATDWHAPGTPLDLVKKTVEVYERDVFGRPIAWRVTAYAVPRQHAAA